MVLSLQAATVTREQQLATDGKKWSSNKKRTL